LVTGIKKKPLRWDRRGCFFSSQLDRAWPVGLQSAANVAADDIAEQIPPVTLELH
jgi:hypothetical protein